MSISRRTFIKSGISALSVSLIAPRLFLSSAQAAGFDTRQPGESKIFVILQMGGGNDGLNMVVPYGLGQYYSVRPTIGIEQSKVLHLNNQIGLNPNMDALHELYKAGKVALVQGVGYPSPNRSHFRSIEIWQTANPEKIIDTGWLGRYLDLSQSGDNLFAAVNVEPTLPKTLAATKCLVPSVNNVFEFTFRTDPQFAADRDVQRKAFEGIYDSFALKRPEVDLLRKVGTDANQASDYLQKIVRNYKSEVKYPNGQVGNGLKFIAQMISGGVNARIFSVNLDGFDTHTNQLGAQNRLLKQLSDGIAAFYQDLELHGLQDDVVLMTFSEFGRRVAENNGRGTDHGTAAPLFVVGGKIKGGVYGDHPSLTNLDEGDLKYNVDFRCVYATILEKWIGADSRQILGQNFDILPIV
jgi:uncharacterized protein (DUF1501 family)